MTTYVYVDDDSDVPPDAVVFRGDNSPADLKTLGDILGNYAKSRGWDGVEIGREL